MRLLLVLCCLALCALPAGAAHASRTQTVSFEAPRDLLDPNTRESALDEIQGLVVGALRLII